MDYIKGLHEICGTLAEALEDANNKIRSIGGKLSAADVDYVDKITHAMKCAKTVIAMEEHGRGGESGSRATDPKREAMVEDLREMMKEAPDESIRKEFEQFISRVRSI